MTATITAIRTDGNVDGELPQAGGDAQRVPDVLMRVDHLAEDPRRHPREQPATTRSRARRRRPPTSAATTTSPTAHSAPSR